MARPRKPTQALRLAGAFAANPARGREREREPKMRVGLGEIPGWLDELAREEWWRVVADLEEAGVTTRVEATALAAYCNAVSVFRKAAAELERDGLTVETEAGLRKHPAASILNESRNAIRVFASEFGMTPSSRSKVAALPTAKGAASVDEFAAV